MIALNDKRSLISLLNFDKQKFRRGWERHNKKKSAKQKKTKTICAEGLSDLFKEELFCIGFIVRFPVL